MIVHIDSRYCRAHSDLGQILKYEEQGIVEDDGLGVIRGIRSAVVMLAVLAVMGWMSYEAFMVVMR